MATNRKYSIARPLQDVRLRKWNPGNVAQFKKVVESLESELNTTMATQVAQGAKRIVSRKVPKITGITLKAGFKNFQLSYNPAKGLKDLLFYEIQKSTTSNFSEEAVTTYTIPQTSIVIAARVQLQNVFFRVRAVNSKFQVGPWSDTATTTARSFFLLESFKTDNFDPARVHSVDPFEPFDAINATVTDITPAQFDTWVDVGGASYSPSAADVCFSIHVGAQSSCINHFSPGDGATKAITNDTSVAFRVTINGVPTGDQANTRAWGYQSRSGEVPSVFSRKEIMSIITMVTGFVSYDGTEAVVPYRVQAKVLSESCSCTLEGGVLTPRTYDDNVRIILSATTLFEVIQTSG